MKISKYMAFIVPIRETRNKNKQIATIRLDKVHGSATDNSARPTEVRAKLPTADATGDCNCERVYDRELRIECGSWDPLRERRERVFQKRLHVLDLVAPKTRRVAIT